MILPATIRDIDDILARPEIELDGGNETGRSSEIGGQYCNNDVVARDCKMERKRLSDGPVRMSPDQLTVYPKRVLVICAYDNRAASDRCNTRYRDVLAERAGPDRCDSTWTGDLVCPNPF